MNDTNESTYQLPLSPQPTLHDPPLVFKLSNDILAHIFLINASRSDLPSVRERAATTIASSQVCKTWRSIALGYPALWSRIIDYTNNSLDQIDELLRRSDPSPFDFGSYHDPLYIFENKVKMLELVLNHSSRLRIFSVKTTAPNWALICSRLLLKPALNLESLKLSFYKTEVRALAGPLFANHAPSLREFFLFKFAVDLSSPVLHLLTDLHVEKAPALHDAPTVAAWLKLLADMPLLRRLTLMDTIREGLTIPIQTEELPVIQLPHLRRLSVQAWLNEAVTLMNQLITPPNCALTLRCDRVHFGPEQKALWSIIDKNLELRRGKSFSRYYFTASLQGDAIYIEKMPDVTSACDFRGEDEEVEDLLRVLLRPGNSDRAVELFLSLLNVFECTSSTATSLKMWLNYRGEDAIEVFHPLVKYFSSFTNLKSLNLANGSHSFLLPLLQHVPSPGSVLLPALDTVYFISSYFRPNSDSLTPVVAFLKWRREQGFPIRKIDIYESRVDRDFVLSQLREVEVEMDYTNDSDPNSDEEEGNN